MIPRILIANGVNLDLLGRREPEVYGNATLADLEIYIKKHAASLAALAGFKDVQVSFFQSNNEAEFLNRLADPMDGFVINPGAWSHTSLAIADRLVGLAVPYTEVHLSNLAQREPFRHKSFLAPNAVGVVYGMGRDSYLAGLLGIMKYLASQQSPQPP